MDTKELLNKLNMYEQEIELTPQVVRNIFNAITFDDVELEEDEELRVETIKTMYNEYKIYGLSYESGYIIPVGDYQSYLNDIANEFGQCLPDGIDDFFNSNELYQYMLNQNRQVANSYLTSCIEFINKNGDKDYYAYTNQNSGDYEGTGYILIDEELV